MGRVAKDAASKQARRTRNTYEGRDTSTSDSESSQEYTSKNGQLPRKRYRSKMPAVPYVAESVVGLMELGLLKEPSVAATPSTIAEEDDCQHFEAEETAGSKKEKKKLVSALARTCRAIIAVKTESRGITEFHSATAPAITVDAYLARIGKYFDCSDSCLLTAFIYIDRIIKLHPAFPVCERTIHRILGASLMVAAKFYDDNFYSNAYYAEVCGLTVKDINRLEGEFLRLLAWNCSVSPGEYEDYRKRVMDAC